ncbi:hypothetical protein DBV14_21230 [Variovorax sp. KBW07]|uniref:hypothetical protein n=1 Tax=Variovorax sp. KBW07 TaxID=2153358 RepID=UPI000F56E9E1|nr:hypothetical protein [Variovorax sp. KBW07]RQO47442.1 hypothetical protein DBV14_21230 [Variovorax sp. KBW07]
MRALRVAVPFLALGLASSAALAADKPFTGYFVGNGRACTGNLYIRTKTVEWHTPFSVCKPAGYEVLEKDFTETHKRLALRLKTRSKHCGHAVIEVEQAAQVSPYAWNITGYPSLEAFQKRELPGWKHSALDERMTLSCPTVLMD